MPHFQLLKACIAVCPSYWAWTLDDIALIRLEQLQFHETPTLQIQSFEMLLFELEHALAQDWFHLCITRGLKDGQYERIRSIFCRPHGNLQEITDRRGG